MSSNYNVKLKEHGTRIIFHLIVTVWCLAIFGPQDWFFYTTHNVVRTISGTATNVYHFKIYYMFQSSYHIYSLVHFLLYESNRADYLMMNVHHIVTLALILASYLLGYFYMCMGVLFFFIHDISDIFVSLAKIVNYVGASSFVMFVTFFLLFSTWAYFRIYIFAVYVIIPALGGLFYQMSFENLTPAFFIRAFLLLLAIALFTLHFVWLLMFFKVGKSLAAGHGRTRSIDHIEEFDVDAMKSE